MKKVILLLVAFMAFMQVQAQNGVAISNSSSATPDASAVLDVQSSSQGVLVPRVDITDLATAAPITSPATSLMVYNTNSTTGPGFFYWDGTAWVTVGGAKEVNDLSDGKTDYGNLESIYLGDSAGAAVTTGGYNVVMGVNAFKTTAGGYESVAIGYKALELGTGSTRNTAVGYLALQENSNTANTAIGSQSLKECLGNNNVALGYLSGSSITTGSNNVFIGSQSASSQTGGADNIVLGYNINLASLTGNNQMNIGNLIYGTDVYNATGKIGIGHSHSAPTSTLDVKGSVTLDYSAGGTVSLDATHYTYNITSTGQTVTLPTAVGIAGRIYIIKLTASGSSASVATTSSQTIDGVSTYSLSAQYKYVEVQSDGANWIIIGQN